MPASTMPANPELRPMLRFIAVLALAASALAAQSFEFASVQQYAPHSNSQATSAPDVIDFYRPTVSAQIIKYVHVSLKSILMSAYGVGKDQIAGPAWLGSEHYDIAAELPQGVLSDQVPSMLQKLLVERFRMTVRRETKPRKGFTLLADKGGPKLAATQTGSKPNIEQGPGHLRFTDCNTAEFARVLSVFMGRPIVDRTGIKGNYDIPLDAYRADLRMASSVGGAWMKSVTDALRNLGLRLEPGTVPATNIIIDKAERIPTRE